MSVQTTKATLPLGGFVHLAAFLANTRSHDPLRKSVLFHQHWYTPSGFTALFAPPDRDRVASCAVTFTSRVLSRIVASLRFCFAGVARRQVSGMLATPEPFRSEQNPLGAYLLPQAPTSVISVSADFR